MRLSVTGLGAIVVVEIWFQSVNGQPRHNQNCDTFPLPWPWPILLRYAVWPWSILPRSCRYYLLNLLLLFEISSEIWAKIEWYIPEIFYVIYFPRESFSNFFKGRLTEEIPQITNSLWPISTLRIIHWNQTAILRRFCHHWSICCPIHLEKVKDVTNVLKQKQTRHCRLPPVSEAVVIVLWCHHGCGFFGLLPTVVHSYHILLLLLFVYLRTNDIRSEESIILLGIITCYVDERWGSAADTSKRSAMIRDRSSIAFCCDVHEIEHRMDSLTV